MRNLKLKKSQIIASALCVILAIICGAVGMYGLSSRTSDKGSTILSDMRLQAILDTAGTGAIDAYVAAEKAAVTAQVREEGGGMKEIREATAKVEEEARAYAESQGIGSVDVSEIDTALLAEALDVLADAQKAYFAEEAAAQARYIEENEDAVVVETETEAAAEEVSADAAMDDGSSDMEMEEVTVDLSGFEATEEMIALQAVVDEAYVALCEEIKTIFPALTDDILDTLKIGRAHV